jgi:hypothetical protein|tara:strand:+ start:806 stop:970 length:165 start_codon:yes stop_codon:yes gene_type:complete
MANITSTTFKKGMTNGYTPQMLGFDNRRAFNLGLHTQKKKKTKKTSIKLAKNLA